MGSTLKLPVSTKDDQIKILVNNGYLQHVREVDARECGDVSACVQAAIEAQLPQLTMRTSLSTQRQVFGNRLCNVLLMSAAAFPFAAALMLVVVLNMADLIKKIAEEHSDSDERINQAYGQMLCIELGVIVLVILTTLLGLGRLISDLLEVIAADGQFFAGPFYYLRNGVRTA